MTQRIKFSGPPNFRLTPDDVNWVVNSLGELGVEINGRQFYLYKGESLEYSQRDAEDGSGPPLKFRRVGKREFGETVWPSSLIKAGKKDPNGYRVEIFEIEKEPEDSPFRWRDIP